MGTRKVVQAIKGVRVQPSFRKVKERAAVQVQNSMTAHGNIPATQELPTVAQFGK